MFATRLSVVSLLTLVLLVSGSGQAQNVYADDNAAANTVTGFTVSGPSLTTPTTYLTNGAGLPGVFAANHTAAISYGSFPNCLFVSDANSSSPFPTGDVAAYMIGTGGVLTPVGNAFDPTNTFGANKGIPLALDRRVGFPYLFAAFTGENKIVFFKVSLNNCLPFYSSSTPATGVFGAPVAGMAVSPAGPHVLVVTYQDGSLQTFKILGGTLAPTGPPVSSTGFTAQGGAPEGVDITANGKFAIFGDRQTIAEVEVAPILPSGLLGPTVDYGGPALASGVNLGPAADSENVWLSPGLTGGLYYAYISNNASRQVTTVKVSPLTGVVTTIPSTSCTAGFTNPTNLNNPTGFFLSGGIGTLATTGTGSVIYVAELGTPSSIAVVKVQASGCTREAPGSPYIDAASNAMTTLSVYPARTF